MHFVCIYLTLSAMYSDLAHMYKWQIKVLIFIYCIYISENKTE